MKNFLKIVERTFKRDSKSLVCWDIDGVLLAGHSPIPRSKEALTLLTDHHVPYIYFTNGSPCSEKQRLGQISKILNIKDNNNLIIMAQSPLRDDSDLHNRNVLFIGNNDVSDIARSVGFKKIVQIDDIEKKYPLLNAVDKSIDNSLIDPIGHVDPIEGIVILDDPVNYEISLQLMLDVVFSGGFLDHSYKKYPAYSAEEMTVKVPIIAMCSDYLWTTTAPWPRIAVGYFLKCFESLFKTMSGQGLKYRSIYGKPSRDTYTYLYRSINSKYGADAFEKIYFIGDNLLTDIYGANNFKRYLNSIIRSGGPEIISILVKTGVNHPHDIDNHNILQMLHESIPRDPRLLHPDYIFQDCFEAAKFICK